MELETDGGAHRYSGSGAATSVSSASLPPARITRLIMGATALTAGTLPRRVLARDRRKEGEVGREDVQGHVVHPSNTAFALAQTVFPL